MAYNLRFMTKVLYRLKRQFGERLEIVWRTSDTIDWDSGDISRDRDSVTVKRAIVMPEKQDRSFQYALAFIATNKNFTYGAFFDTVRRLFLIDDKDLPADFRIEVGHYIVYKNSRYEILKVDDFHKCWFVEAKQLDNKITNNVVKVDMHTALSLSQEVADG